MFAPLHRALALVTIAAVGVGTASAQAKPHGKQRAKAARRGPSVATVSGKGRGWIPPGAVPARAPLTGSLAANGSASATTLALTAPTGPDLGALPSTPAGPTTPAVTSVGVTLKDTPSYLAQLSRASVTAGSVTVQLQNRGEDPHNLRVVPTDHDGATIDFPLTDPGATATRAITLTPGTYYLFCTLTVPVNHAGAGMNATLTVTAAP
jgi:plastocyanin